MIDAAVRAFLLALSSMIATAEPAAEQGGGGVRMKSANVCIQAIQAPAAVLQSPEPHPVGADVPPSASPTNVRAWLIRTAATSEGVKVLNMGNDFVDVRIFQ